MCDVRGCDLPGTARPRLTRWHPVDPDGVQRRAAESRIELAICERCRSRAAGALEAGAAQIVGHAEPGGRIELSWDE